jgi:hypothetical protein
MSNQANYPTRSALFMKTIGVLVPELPSANMKVEATGAAFAGPIGESSVPRTAKPLASLAALPSQGCRSY